MLKRVFYQITSQCNFKCHYCWGIEKEFQANLLDAIPFFHKHSIAQIRITGGEPLIHTEIIEFINSVPNEKIIQTNGSLSHKLLDINEKEHIKILVTMHTEQWDSIVSFFNMIEHLTHAFDVIVIYLVRAEDSSESLLKLKKKLAQIGAEVWLRAFAPRAKAGEYIKYSEDVHSMLIEYDREYISNRKGQVCSSKFESIFIRGNNVYDCISGSPQGLISDFEPSKTTRICPYNLCCCPEEGFLNTC